MLVSELVTGNPFIVSAKKLSLPRHDSSDWAQTPTWDVFPHRREAGNFAALSDELTAVSIPKRCFKLL